MTGTKSGTTLVRDMSYFGDYPKPWDKWSPYWASHMGQYLRYDSNAIRL